MKGATKTFNDPDFTMQRRVAGNEPKRGHEGNDFPEYTSHEFNTPRQFYKKAANLLTLVAESQFFSVLYSFDLSISPSTTQENPGQIAKNLFNAVVKEDSLNLKISELTGRNAAVYCYKSNANEYLLMLPKHKKIIIFPESLTDPQMLAELGSHGFSPAQSEQHLANLKIARAEALKPKAPEVVPTLAV